MLRGDTIPRATSGQVAAAPIMSRLLIAFLSGPDEVIIAGQALVMSALVKRHRGRQMECLRLPPKADIGTQSRNVRFVPLGRFRLPNDDWLDLRRIKISKRPWRSLLWRKALQFIQSPQRILLSQHGIVDATRIQRASLLIGELIEV